MSARLAAGVVVISALALIFLGVLGALAIQASAASPLRPGELVVVDSGAEAVFKVDPRSGSITTLHSGPPLGTPVGLAVDRQGRVLIADLQPDASLGNGAIFRLRPGGTPVPIASSALFGNPQDVVVSPSGPLIVADFDANPNSVPGEPPGALFEVRPGKSVRTLATSPLFENPRHVAIDAAGRLLVSDSTADPPGSLGGDGAIFRFFPGASPAMLATSPLFDEPSDLTLDARGRVLVADGEAGAGHDGAIFRFRPGRAPSLLATSPLFDGPVGIARDTRGRVVVSDTSANPNSLPGSPGALFRVLPGGQPRLLSASALLEEPNDAEVVPPRCIGRLATVVGSPARDVLRGTRFADVIAGLAGADRIFGLRGNDRICGGTGRDRLLGGKGADKLRGGPGRDLQVQ